MQARMSTGGGPRGPHMWTDMVNLTEPSRPRRSSRYNNAAIVNLTANNNWLSGLPSEVRQKIVARLNNAANVAALSETSKLLRDETKKLRKMLKLAHAIEQTVLTAHRLATDEYVRPVAFFNADNGVTAGATHFRHVQNYFETPSGMQHRMLKADVFMDTIPYVVKVTYTKHGRNRANRVSVGYRQHDITIQGKHNTNKLWVMFRFDYNNHWSIRLRNPDRVTKIGAIDPGSSAKWVQAARIAFRKLGITE